VLLLIVAAPALARPPEIRDFVRMDELSMKLLNLQATFAREEAFRSKPRQERMILLFMSGAPKFENRQLTGEWVVREVLEKWAVWKLEEVLVPAGAKEIVKQLPHALKERFAKGGPIPKQARYKASLQLVKALTHKNFYVREAAIKSLQEIYGRTLLYKPDESPTTRRQKQRKWRQLIEKLKR
jgi:hypothetical protein